MSKNKKDESYSKKRCYDKNLMYFLFQASDYTLKNANRVVFKMKNLRLSSGGTYKCEISADAPTFKTLSKESNLSVIGKFRWKNFPSCVLQRAINIIVKHIMKY